MWPTRSARIGHAATRQETERSDLSRPTPMAVRPARHSPRRDCGPRSLVERVVPRLRRRSHDPRATFTLLSTTADEHGAGGFVWWSCSSSSSLRRRFRGELDGPPRHGRRARAQLRRELRHRPRRDARLVRLAARRRRHPFRGFRFWLLVLELATVVAAAVALRRFRFPLLVFVVAAAIWFFVVDLISGGGGLVGDRHDRGRARVARWPRMRRSAGLAGRTASGSTSRRDWRSAAGCSGSSTTATSTGS